MTNEPNYTSEALFWELRDDPSDEMFMIFAAMLDDEGKSTQAELIRTSVLAGNWQLAAKYGRDNENLEATRKKLEAKFIEETFKEPTLTILKSYPKNISFDRGVIKDLRLEDSSSMRDGKLQSVPEGLLILGNLDILSLYLRSLPKMQVAGDVNLDSCVQIASLLDFRVGGILKLRGTKVTKLLEDLKVGGLNITCTNIADLPPGLKLRDLDVSYSKVKRLPDDLVVENKLVFHRGQITESEALKISEMKGLSLNAKVTGLKSAGYEALADLVERDAVIPQERAEKLYGSRPEEDYKSEEVEGRRRRHRRRSRNETAGKDKNSERDLF